MAAECVKVIVRCRPMNEREDKLSCKSVICMESKVGQCAINNPKDKKAPPKSFTFDGAYFIDSTTEQIYNDIGYPLVEGVTEGYNGTIFAYGQTGCGKSFSMQGITDPASQRGIIPRAFDHIFETVSVVEGQKFLIHASYLEIYNEDIRDLLGKDTKHKLDIKEHPDKGVYVAELTMHPVHNVRECERIMERGWKNRATGATLMNNDSSRSHSIFTINMEMTTTDEEGEDHIRVGKLNLVDLAGSERQAKTGSTGDRLKEATKINLSLSALGNVISALVDGKSKHIPYRDSKLTRLLQDSLGGNTKTLMVACISPADNNYEESLSTLRYANRAKNIKNKPKINEDPKDALLREYQEEIQKLKAMLMGQMPIPDGGFSGMDLAQIKPVSDKPTKATSNAEVTRLRDELELEKNLIRQEFDLKLDDMKAMYEEEKDNKVKLEDGMLKLRQYYDDKLHSVDGQIANLPPTAAENGDGESERSGSVLSREYPESSADKTAPDSRDDTMNILSVMSLTDEMDNDSDGTVTPKRAIHVRTTSSENTDVGILVPTSSPTGPSDLFKLQHDEALKRTDTTSEAQDHKDVMHRLQELQQQMVGGENLDNSEIKERHKKRKEFAEERKIDLAKAIENMDDDGIMLQIYDNVQDELKAKNAQLSKEKERVEAGQVDLSDVQADFEKQRSRYLHDLRKNGKEISLLTALLERIQPCVRRDCNYSNIDKIRDECQWDENSNKWILPKIVIEKTALPSGSIMPGVQTRSLQHRNGVETNGYDEEDRLKEKLNRNDVSNRYFQAKKSQLRQAQEIGQINMQEIRETFATTDNSPYTNGNSYYDDEPISNELKAAQVHGTLASEEGLVRRPMKLESLQGQKVRRSKKKKSTLEPL